MTLQTAVGRSAVLIFFFFFCTWFCQGGGGGAPGPAAKAACAGGELSTPSHSQGSWSELLVGPTFPILEEKKLLLLQSVLAREG